MSGYMISDERLAELNAAAMAHQMCSIHASDLKELVADYRRSLHVDELVEALEDCVELLEFRRDGGAILKRARAALAKHKEASP